MATSPIPVPQTQPPVPASNATAAPQQATQQQAASAVPVPSAPTPQSASAQASQPNPAVAKVKAAAHSATQTLSKAVTSLPKLVEQSVQQDKKQKQVRDQVVIKTVFDANNAMHKAVDQIQKTKAGLQEIDQHWKEAQALPDDDPSKVRSIAYLAQMHQAAVAHLKQAMGTQKQAQAQIQGLTADKANRKVLAQAFGYDEKAASSPERMYVVNLAQKQAAGIQQGAAKELQAIPPGPSSPNERPDSQPGSSPQSGTAPNSSASHESFGAKAKHVSGVIGQVLGDLFLPRGMEDIPGTRQYKERVQEKALELQKALASIADTESQTDLREAQAKGQESAAEKEKLTADKTEATLKASEDRTAELAKHAATAVHGKTGVLFDQSVPYGWTAPDGKQYTASDPNLPEEGKNALHDANVAYERYGKMKAQTGAAANLRAKAYWDNYLLHAQGVGPDSKPLAGSMQTDTGQTVGSANAPNVRPTGTERGRADLATSALEQTNFVLGKLQSRPELFGPTGGRITEINRFIGSSDPDAQAVRAAAGTAGDHLAGVFGGRNQEALQFLHEVAGGNVTMNPKALAAGIEQLNKAAKTIQAKGTVHTVGSSTEIKKPSGKNDPLGLF
jgi:hypothetical protein